MAVVCMIAGFYRGVNVLFTVLGYYKAWIGIYRRFGTTYQSILKGYQSQRTTVLCLFVCV